MITLVKAVFDVNVRIELPPRTKLPVPEPVALGPEPAEGGLPCTAVATMLWSDVVSWLMKLVTGERFLGAVDSLLQAPERATNVAVTAQDLTDALAHITTSMLSTRVIPGPRRGCRDPKRPLTAGIASA